MGGSEEKEAETRGAGKADAGARGCGVMEGWEKRRERGRRSEKEPGKVKGG